MTTDDLQQVELGDVDNPGGTEEMHDLSLNDSNADGMIKTQDSLELI